MAREIHYEVFRRLGSSGGWTLHDAVAGREAALRMAEELMAAEKATGVKVVKETYDPDTGEYLSLKIFEEGHTRLKMRPAEEDLPHALPCFKPEDFYSYHARSTLARLLHDFLARQKLTVTELIHRADALEKLEATGTIYQHAIQKIAVAHAASTSTPVQQIIKSLNELATRAMQRVYRDAHNGCFTALKPGEFAGFAKKMAAAADGAYWLNASIAQYLASSANWNDKLQRLLLLLREVPAEGAAHDLLVSSIDAYIAEVLGGAAALHELIGQSKCLGDALMALVDLFLGSAPAECDPDAPLAALSHNFALDGLPESRTAIASRITAELRSMKRLCPGALQDEMKVLRQIANKMVIAPEKYLSRDDLIAAFTLRSRRIVNHEAVSEHLAEAALPDEKLERLLRIEENIIGAENKRQLAAFALPIVGGAAFEDYFLSSKTAPLVRLRRLGELQARIRKSSFQETERQELSGRIDKIACEVEARARILMAIDTRVSSPVEKAIAVLALCSSSTFTEGKLSAKARAIILTQLGQPGFFKNYVSRMSAGPEKPDAEIAMCELIRSLQSAGISPETGLKAIAA
jgi:hypothetical protein